ncbi:hypothetical protein [Aurantiacibacter flavus]|uniref:Uncharacterized protein n=1 Tax=Aurantiacibacter flavus TaxID=3145232 RepID=A0ABV0D0K9_9SPHN
MAKRTDMNNLFLRVGSGCRARLRSSHLPVASTETHKCLPAIELTKFPPHQKHFSGANVACQPGLSRYETLTTAGLKANGAQRSFVVVEQRRL